MGEVLTEWVAGGVPPLGAFNGIGAEHGVKPKLTSLLSELEWVNALPFPFPVAREAFLDTPKLKQVRMQVPI